MSRKYLSSSFYQLFKVTTIRISWRITWKETKNK